VRYEEPLIAGVTTEKDAPVIESRHFDSPRIVRRESF
jgi:hypothetical protein